LLLLTALLWGCKRKQEPAAAKALAKASAQQEAHEPPPPPPARNIPQPQKDMFNVAFVYVGPVGDGGWTYAHDQGRKLLDKDKDIYTAYIEKVGEGAEAEQVIRSLARKGFDLIVATSFGYMDAVEAVAGEFPRVKFVHVSGHKFNGKNFGNLFGAMECMKFLAGMIAGARAKADGKTKLGFIAPFPIPEVIRLGNALMLGARKTCADCTMEIRWLNSWFDPTREREAAESLIKTGAHVVITGADTPGPIVAAKDAGKWAIGYDSENACRVAPKHCLTTPYWNWGPVYVDLVRRIRAGTWKGGAEYPDVDKGIVGLSGFMKGQQVPPGVPAAVVPEIKKILKLMQAGKFDRFDVFAGPLTDNTGKQILGPDKRLDQRDLLGLKGCTVCMNWLTQGITGRLPERSSH